MADHARVEITQPSPVPLPCRDDGTYMNHLVQLSGSEGRVGYTRRELEIVRILVVDDDPQAATLLEMALADARFARTIEVVGTAACGLKRIQDDAHDVYLVDQRLPDATGLELIRNAKAHGTSKPFILMTGYGSERLDEAALEEGAADYVEKHLLSTQLERSIRYALRDWQATGALLEREEAQRSIQIDRLPLLGTLRPVGQSAQHRERIVIRGRDVEVARGGQRGVGGVSRHRERDCHQQDDGAYGVSHFFLISTLSLAGAVAVTVVV